MDFSEILRNDNATCNQCTHNSEPLMNCIRCEEYTDDGGVYYHNFEPKESTDENRN